MSNTSNGTTALATLIAGSIREAGGRITFERFMEMALYHPALGYYTTSPSIGCGGDFYTNVSIGSLYGRIFARQLYTYRKAMGTPPDFRVLEFGGHCGQLREDVLTEAPDLSYSIVEAGGPIPDRITGCIISNELLDAFPVHRVRVVNGRWRELYVVETAEGMESFAEVTGPLSTPRLAERLEGLPAHLMEGYTTEINLRAIDWIGDMARCLERGYIITVDYGYEHDGYFAPHRREGTLLCHFEHTANRDPFIRIGQQDITAHVDFTSVMDAGRKAGLETILFCDQSQFLLEAGRELVEELVALEAGKWSPERNQLHQLIHPTLMGRTFKVLVQRKSVQN
jgi:SAM-dependent MidA family methyltransferase